MTASDHRSPALSSIAHQWRRHSIYGQTDRQTEVFYGTPLVSWSTGVPLPYLIRGGDNRDCEWVTHCPVEGQGEEVPSECLHVDSHWSLGGPMWRCCVVCSPGVGGLSMERRNSQTVFGCPNKHVFCRQLTRICGSLVPLLVRWGGGDK